VLTFDLYRFRFRFRAIDPVWFPPGQAANIIRGAFGTIGRQVVSPEIYSVLFGRRAAEPAGKLLTDSPRPFVLRCTHLDGSIAEPGDVFFFDTHIFELRRPVLGCFQNVFERFAEEGIGPGRGRAELSAVQQLDLADNPCSGSGPSSIPLQADAVCVPSVTLRFVTPTELKAGGRVMDQPEFAVLFGRLAERIQALDSLYGNSAATAELPPLHAGAGNIRLTRCDLTWEYSSRKSTRTGRVHPLGGFSGEADYQGELSAFLPWLRAMRWAGVGRQTVWGKGEVHVLESVAETPLLTRATPR
jgi:CRISPR-associated endoribonuclease Cas6